MFDLDAIVLLKRASELSEAYKKLSGLGYAPGALNSACSSLYSVIEEKLQAYEDAQLEAMAGIEIRYVTPDQTGMKDRKAEASINSDKPGIYEFQDKFGNREPVELLVQAILMQLLRSRKKGEIRWRLIDVHNAGASFGILTRIAESNSALYGGMIYAKEQDVTRALNELDTIIQDNIRRLGGASHSVFEYNKTNETPIPVTVAAVFDEGMLNSNNRNMLQKIESNAEKGGVIILKGFPADPNADNRSWYGQQNSVTSVGQDKNVWKITVDHNMLELSRKDIAYTGHWFMKRVSEEDVAWATEKIKVDTRMESHVEISKNTLFDMNDSQKLSIPFAVDENNRVVCLELGGSAPAHALISGGTGSGKSVMLHTIINSLMQHYHPNDVEIWAIDYKAVEFAVYTEEPIPHITVVGQDNSEEFSLSLLDLIKKEFDRRKELFLNAGVTKLEEYRAKGHTLSRMVIVIDEFHNLTQAVAQNETYRNILENLLSEMRSQGMSFIFCSQFISSGLQGLTEKGRNMINCRLCLKQDSASETRETLADSSMSAMSEYMDLVKNFATGQVLYKRYREGGGYDFLPLRVLFSSGDVQNQIIHTVKDNLEDTFTYRHRIICKNTDRYSITDKEEHTMVKFCADGIYQPPRDGIAVFPGGPTSLEEEYRISMERQPGSNLLVCCSDDDMRKSVILHSILGFLMDRNTIVNVTIPDENNGDCIELKELLDMVQAPNLHVYFGGEPAIRHMGSLQKLKPQGRKNVVELFYGLHRLKSVLYLLQSDAEDEAMDVIAEEPAKPAPENKRVQELREASQIKGESMAEKMAAVNNLIAMLDIPFETEPIPAKTEEVKAAPVEEDKLILDQEVLAGILEKLFEYGPDMGIFGYLAMDNAKQYKMIGLRKMNAFEYRIGSKMSEDDAYTVFSSESFVKKADEKTMVVYTGSSRNARTMRPYLLPEKQLIDAMNERYRV